MIVRMVSTDYYNIGEDVWHKGPDLCEARDSHSSCALGSNLFVFGGLEVRNASKASIEYIDFKAYLRGNIAAWQLVNQDLEARYDTILVPLNTHELLIFGGKKGSVDFGENERANTLDSYTIFDTSTNEVERFTDIGLKVSGWMNQSVKGRDGQAIALVFGSDSSYQDGTVLLVQRDSEHLQEFTLEQ